MGDTVVAASKSKQDFCAKQLRVLADPTRLTIVRVLMAGPQHVGKLNEQIEIDQSLLSHHLRILRDSGLVVSERDGKAVLYRLAPDVKGTTRSRGIQLGCCVLSFE